MVFLLCTVNHIKVQILGCNPNQRLIIVSKDKKTENNYQMKTDDMSRKKPITRNDKIAISISAQEFFKTLPLLF